MLWLLLVLVLLLFIVVANPGLFLGEGEEDAGDVENWCEDGEEGEEGISSWLLAQLLLL